MKNFLLSGLMLCAFAVFAGDSTAVKSNPMLGVWKASQKGDYYYFHFENDSSMKIIHNTDTTLIKYSVDTSETPMHIDLHVLDRYTLEIFSSSKGIYEWMGSSKIRLKFDLSVADRPRNFLPKGSPDTYMLVKQ